MVKISEDELRQILREFEDGQEVSLELLMKASGWHIKDMQNFLAGYDERQLKVARREKVHSLEHFVYFPKRKSFPIFEISDGPPPAPVYPQLREEPCEVCPVDETFGFDGTDVIVPVDQEFRYNELIRQLQAVGLARELSVDTVDWWLMIGHLEKSRGRIGFYEADTYRTVPTGMAEARYVEAIKMVRLPRTIWDISRKGGFYDWLEAEFGWTRTEAVRYFREELDMVERLGVGRYRLPREIPIKEYRLVRATEPKPVPIRMMATLRWEAGSGHSGKTDKYDQEHEINGFIRIPRSLSREDADQIMADVIQLILDDRDYPPLSEILSKWHNAVCHGSTTTQNQDDGYWRQIGLKEMAEGQFDAFQVWKFYRIGV